MTISGLGYSQMTGAPTEKRRRGRRAGQRVTREEPVVVAAAAGASRPAFTPYHSLAVPRGPRPLGTAAGEGKGDKPVTTAMLRNIPNKYTQKSLLEEIGEVGFAADLYDFFYLPMDVHNRANVGYAFINFLSPEAMRQFARRFTDYTFRKHPSLKIASVSPAHIQGLEENLRHLANRAVTWSRNGQYRPIVKVNGQHRDIREILSELAMLPSDADHPAWEANKSNDSELQSPLPGYEPQVREEDEVLEGPPGLEAPAAPWMDPAVPATLSAGSYLQGQAGGWGPAEDWMPREDWEPACIPSARNLNPAADLFVPWSLMQPMMVSEPVETPLARGGVAEEQEEQREQVQEEVEACGPLEGGAAVSFTLARMGLQEAVSQWLRDAGGTCSASGGSSSTRSSEGAPGTPRSTGTQVEGEQAF